ncbi:MAG: hypothetical protein HRJ53_29570 [Acidobacteria bacterium Pan2503]|uniref:Uncharacterized protein n=1 Tax=Candidatus Acidiferrum panamense TaxID=2741543 RepID=A0A7V8T054_9BACT|nr:hypothetical protein [Candidatus Acidoferrum panamensis]
MAPRFQFQTDPVPQGRAGVLSARCECGWECTVILPEEHLEMVQAFFTHIQNDHKIPLPEFVCTWLGYGRT